LKSDKNLEISINKPYIWKIDSERIWEIIEGWIYFIKKIKEILGKINFNKEYPKIKIFFLSFGKKYIFSNIQNKNYLIFFFFKSLIKFFLCINLI
jgi:hypothetical protein